MPRFTTPDRIAFLSSSSLSMVVVDIVVVAVVVVVVVAVVVVVVDDELCALEGKVSRADVPSVVFGASVLSVPLGTSVLGVLSVLCIPSELLSKSVLTRGIDASVRSVLGDCVISVLFDEFVLSILASTLEIIS